MGLQPVTVIIRGEHDTGRTTLASLIKMFLNENGYEHVKIEDTAPLPADKKSAFMDRFLRNREREILIRVETEKAVALHPCFDFNWGRIVHDCKGNPANPRVCVRCGEREV